MHQLGKNAENPWVPALTVGEFDIYTPPAFAWKVNYPVNISLAFRGGLYLEQE
jgi:hypothetical protein